jgi:hypothetical protein
MGRLKFIKSHKKVIAARANHTLRDNFGSLDLNKEFETLYTQWTQIIPQGL